MEKFVVISALRGYTQYFENLEYAKETAEQSSWYNKADMIIANVTLHPHVIAIYSNGNLIFKRYLNVE